jgi:RNA polymerase sigma-70 factor (ECF subfamily)
MNPERRTSASDRDLATALRRDGAEDAFRELYRRHTPRVHGLLRRLLGGDGRDAEDAVQETWIRAVDGLERFRWEAAFSTWLYSIAVHVGRDALRRRRRDKEDPWVDGFDAPVAEPPLGMRVDLERAIALLPDGYRAVLVLHDVEGQMHETIAAQLGISVGTSKSQLHRARRALRALLAPGATLRNGR